MSMDLKQFERLKKRADQLRDKKARVEGKLEQSMEELKKKYGCKTIEEAEQKLKQMELGIERVSKEYESALSTFEKALEKCDGV